MCYDKAFKINYENIKLFDKWLTIYFRIITRMNCEYNVSLCTIEEQVQSIHGTTGKNLMSTSGEIIEFDSTRSMMRKLLRIHSTYYELEVDWAANRLVRITSCMNALIKHDRFIDCCLRDKLTLIKTLPDGTVSLKIVVRR
ncbi:hypothetical protein LOAG_10433 [Loa loa]|uniref:Uncharacterized protein n=1 Tax=Loa loa TaxID=7209 RepID=A0A1I7W3U4_LOALO|nr:hypothetical protein LOAG_10433 [Loa loa]EFO18068.1 hypothetical protein LOAG_10433 [Loa loa]